jgi:hypothetical protein
MDTQRYIVRPLNKTPGDTGTASRIQIQLQNLNGYQGAKERKPFSARVRVVNTGTVVNSTNATLAAAQGSTVRKAHTPTKDLELLSGVANAATNTLTMDTDPTAADTMTIDDEVYTFVAAASAPGQITIDGTVANTQANLRTAVNDGDTYNAPHKSVTLGAATTLGGSATATNNLTMDTDPTAGDTCTIDGVVYTFAAAASAPGQITLDGAVVANTQASFRTAVNSGDIYNDPHPTATLGAFAADVSAVSARTPGSAGNSIATTETFTAITNIFSAAALAGGADGGLDNEDGNIYLDLTDATAETVDVIVSASEVESKNADYSTRLEVTHAAP